MGHHRKQTISFFVSSRCNLNCVYCYIPKVGRSISPEDSVIDLDFAVAGMKDFFAWSPMKSIRFFSAGEPTTEFETMVRIRDAAHDLVGDQLRAELQTNGVFSERVAGWVEQNIDIVWVSMDGPPEINDIQRPGLRGQSATDIMIRNIRRFASNPKMQAGIRFTVGASNYDHQIDLLKYFKSLGVRYVCGAPCYTSTVNPGVAVPKLVEFAKGFVPAFFAAQDMGMFYQTHLMVNFDEPVECYCRACTTPICPQLTSDGYVSCCDWAAFGPKYFPGIYEQCIYGRWDRENGRIEYFEDRKCRIEQRNIHHLGQGDCRGCEVLEHCAGGCIAKIMARSGDIHKMDPNWCEAVRYLAQHLPLDQGRYPFHHS